MKLLDILKESMADGNAFKAFTEYAVAKQEVQENEEVTSQNRDLSAPENWLKELLNNMKSYKSPKYSDSIFFHINKEIYLWYNQKAKTLYINHDKIYTVLKSKFGLRHHEIQVLVKTIAEEQSKLEITSVLDYKVNSTIDKI